MWKDHTEENIQNTKVIDQKISTFQIQIAKCEEKNLLFQNKILNNNTLYFETSNGVVGWEKGMRFGPV